MYIYILCLVISPRVDRLTSSQSGWLLLSERSHGDGSVSRPTPHNISLYLSITPHYLLAGKSRLKLKRSVKKTARPYAVTKLKDP